MISSRQLESISILQGVNSFGVEGAVVLQGADIGRDMIDILSSEKVRKVTDYS